MKFIQHSLYGFFASSSSQWAKRNTIFSKPNRFWFSERKMIIPEPFSNEKVDDYYLVKSKTYQFLINRLPSIHQIFTHQIQTPANVLKKQGIHILPKSMPEVNKKQKYQAVQKKLKEQSWQKLQKIQQSKTLFHMSRKLKHQTKIRMDRIGIIEGKYKHYMLFRPYSQNAKQKTRQEYAKNGVKLQCLNFTIYPKGDIWMPTNQKYLGQFVQYMKRFEGDSNIKSVLDIGCGSGVLSYITAKSFKKAQIVGLDSNDAAIDTCNITAASNKLQNFEAIKFDILEKRGLKQLQETLKRQKKPEKYDMIIVNPPWIHAKKLMHQSDIEGGVYDDKGKMLETSLKYAAQLLRNKQSKILLIFSDLSKIIGIEAKGVQQICKQNSLLINNLQQKPLINQMPKPNPLNQLKQKAKIQFYEIKKA